MTIAHICPGCGCVETRRDPQPAHASKCGWRWVDSSGWLALSIAVAKDKEYDQ